MIGYGLSSAAHKAIHERFGPMDLDELRAHFAVPGLAFVPQVGDTLRWDVIGDVLFEVKGRLCTFSVDGSGMRFDLLLDLSK